MSGFISKILATVITRITPIVIILLLIFTNFYLYKEIERLQVKNAEKILEIKGCRRKNKELMSTIEELKRYISTMQEKCEMEKENIKRSCKRIIVRKKKLIKEYRKAKSKIKEDKAEKKNEENNNDFVLDRLNSLFP